MTANRQVRPITCKIPVCGTVESMQVITRKGFSDMNPGSPTEPAVGTPTSSVNGETEARLNVSVVFTNVEATLAALRVAATLVSRLDGRITLMVPEVVPYHLPLEKPPVVHEWNEKRFRTMASGCPVETVVRFYLCRDAEETLAKELKPHSLVVIGGEKHWWPTRESRLAKQLRRAGHEVILTETE